MIWTYRIFRDSDGRYSIREVYYEDDGSLISYGKKAAMPVESSFENLLQMVEWFREAFDVPVLSLAEVESEIATHAPDASAQKDLSERAQTVPLKQLIAQLAQENETEAELELQQ